jgi:hypothetical protein
MKTFKQTKLKELETILDRFFERIIDRNTAIDQILIILSSTIDEAEKGLSKKEIKKSLKPWVIDDNGIKYVYWDDVLDCLDVLAKLGGVKE